MKWNILARECQNITSPGHKYLFSRKIIIVVEHLDIILIRRGLRAQNPGPFKISLCVCYMTMIQDRRQW